MRDYERSIHNNPDAQAWAKFFIDTIAEQSLRIEDIDEALMIGWFANAMMAMHDHTKRAVSETHKWVGLNWDDLPEIYVGDIAFLHGAKWAEAKLREKNSL